MMATRRLTRRERQEQTREAILRSAADLFARKGVEGTSVQEIADRAGLTQGAIYSNFKSKADVWWAIAETLSRTLDFGDALTGDRDLRDELGDLGRLGARVLRESSRTSLLLDQEFHLFLMRHAKARARARRELGRANDAAAPKIKEAFAKRGKKPPLSPSRMMLLMAVLGSGLLHYYMIAPELIDDEFCGVAFALLAGCEPDVGS